MQKLPSRQLNATENYPLYEAQPRDRPQQQNEGNFETAGIVSRLRPEAREQEALQPYPQPPPRSLPSQKGTIKNNLHSVPKARQGLKKRSIQDSRQTGCHPLALPSSSFPPCAVGKIVTEQPAVLPLPGVGRYSVADFTWDFLFFHFSFFRFWSSSEVEALLERKINC